MDNDLRHGLKKTRKGFMEKMLGLFSGKKIDEEFFDDLEEMLIQSDVGLNTSLHLVQILKDKAKKDKISDSDYLRTVFIDEISRLLKKENEALNIQEDKLNVFMIVGVNGVGKTTTIAKLANHFKINGKKVLIAAADTFRAAAIDQLKIWGGRTGVDVIAHQEGADPSAVVFDALQAAKARKTEILLVDTAGRLHNKTNLMEELKKMRRVIEKEVDVFLSEVILVLDATTGQNAIAQTKTFSEAVDLTGVILTKLDGTAKGGVVIGIVSEQEVPVKFIGIGEGVSDFKVFDAEEFAKAIFDKED